MSHLKLVTQETAEKYHSQRIALQKERSSPGASADSFKYNDEKLPDNTMRSLMISCGIGFSLTLFFLVLINFLAGLV